MQLPEPIAWCPAQLLCNTLSSDHRWHRDGLIHSLANKLPQFRVSQLSLVYRYVAKYYLKKIPIHVFDLVVIASEGLTDEPVLPRYRKAPRRLDGGAQPHRYSCPKDRYRHAYFEVLELASGEVDKRFDQSDLGVIQEIESLLLGAANGKDIPEIPKQVTEFFEKKVDPARLRIQLLMLPDAIKTAHEGTPVTIKRVTNLRTVADTLNQSAIYKGMLGEVDKVLHAYFTFPVTSATAERSFSSLRRIKTFLRNTMTHQRLNNLFLLYVHSERTDTLDLIAIAKEFVATNNRRMNYFGKF